MKSNYEIRIFRDEGVQYIPMKCTLYQARKVQYALAFSLVEQDVERVELWLCTRSVYTRMSKQGVR